MKLIFALIVIFPSILLAQSECPSTIHSGTATYYVDGTGGSCSFPNDEVQVNYCAVNTADFASASLCGACLQVTGSNGTEIVYVVSEYLGAAAGWLDLSEVAFQTIVGPTTLGMGAITWHVVDCPFFVATPLELTNIGSNPYYINFTIHKHTNPIQSVEVFVGGVWEQLSRQNSNQWTSVGFAINNETVINARVTDIFGEQIVVNGIDMTNTAVAYPASGNFTACSPAEISAIHEPNFDLYQSSDRCILNFDGEAKNIAFYDVQGNLLDLPVLLDSTNKKEFSTTALAAGIYVVKVDFGSLGVKVCLLTH